MEVKILVLLSLFFGSSFGQSIQCTYSNITFNGVPNYGCTLSILNPGGFDEFESIAGTHADGRTDDDVTVLSVNFFTSRTVNFPQIICQQFPNLVAIDYSLMDVAVLNENTISGCTNLEWIRFWLNEIEEVHERAFANNINLQYLDLDGNNFVSLSENVFSGLVNLEILDLSNNNLGTLPATIFNGLSIQALILMNIRIAQLNPQWFEGLTRLNVLSLYNNNITSLPQNVMESIRTLTYFNIGRNPLGNLPGNTFDPLSNLEQLYIARIGATEINRRWFQNLQNLEFLFIYSNLFTSIPENVFDDLTSLWALDIGDNGLTEAAIPGNLFDRLTNLLWLIVDFNSIQELNPDWFRNLNQLEYLDFNFNQVDTLAQGIFASFDALVDIEFWDNNIKTLDRDAFGNIGSLAYVDFDGNVINAIEEQFLREAEPLINLYLAGNLCISTRFYLFAQNRESFMPRLSVCTRNYLFTVETVTEASDQYNFHQGPYPGIQLRVNSPEDINIALTPFNFPWTPMVEIFIGVGNNTVSRIVRNRDTDVVVVPTPNILEEGRWSGFRVTWSNHVILVSREGQQFPFMAYTLEDFFPVNFYGLRSPQNRAVWSIQPVEAEVLPFEV